MLKELSPDDSHDSELSVEVKGDYEIWFRKKNLLYRVLTSICNLIKDDEKSNFHVHYWVLKTIGDITMHFKDIKESTQAFIKAKHHCEFFDMYCHKMIVYKQLGYLYRL